MVKDGLHGNKLKNPPSDPLREFVFRQTTGDQIRSVLEQRINPFTKARWSERYRSEKILHVRKKLQVFAYMDSFLEAFKTHQVIIVHGDTGTGKTTQIPQFVAYADLPQSNGKKIGCAQTRRIAASAAAQRVADEMDLTLGQEVGYSVRFDNKTSDSSFLVFMTDGMLLQDAKQDKYFSQYSTIILDEVHERTMATDVLMGFLKGALAYRADLKLVIMSATMDAASLGAYFGPNDPFLLEIPGSSYPVDIVYFPLPIRDYQQATVQKILQIHGNEPEGDILVFLTGEYEIEETCAEIRNLAAIYLHPPSFGELVCLPLYANLPQCLQRRVWEDLPPPAPGYPPPRKVVIATNIAETSLTIDGIVYIVDAGFAKPKIYEQNSDKGYEWHTVRRISKSSAHQRKGRAGRTRPGKCFRLYTKQEYQAMPLRDLPDMQTMTLEELVLTLAANGYRDPTTFPYMDKPDPKALARSQRHLKHLKAIDKNNALTALGRQMLQFPLDVQLSKMLITSAGFKCSDEIATIVAMLSAPPLWLCPYDLDKRAMADQIKQDEFGDKHSDHITLLNAYNIYMAETSHASDAVREEWCSEKYISFKALQEAEKIRIQLLRIMYRQRIPLVSSYVPTARTGANARLSADDAEEQVRLRRNIRKALLSGFFLQLAHSKALGELSLTPADNTRGTLNLGSGGTRAQVNKGNRAYKMRNSFQTVRDGTNAVLHRSSLPPLNSDSKWVIYHSFVYTKEPFIRTVTTIEESLLLKYISKVYDTEGYKDRETFAAVNYIKAQTGQKSTEVRKSDTRADQETRIVVNHIKAPFTRNHGLRPPL